MLLEATQETYYYLIIKKDIDFVVSDKVNELSKELGKQ